MVYLHNGSVGFHFLQSPLGHHHHSRPLEPEPPHVAECLRRAGPAARRRSSRHPHRLVKVRELATLLEFYLERAIRYGAMSEDAASEARFFLCTLEEPYRVDFARAAIIFDFDKPGTEPAEVESGVEFHRIGVDLIQQLIEAAAPESCLDEAEVAAGEAPTARSLEKVRRRRECAGSVPALAKAAFLGRPRDRSVSWEDLRARQTLGEEVVMAPPVPAVPTIEPAPPPVEPAAAASEERPEETSEAAGPEPDMASESHAVKAQGEAVQLEIPVATC